MRRREVDVNPMPEYLRWYDEADWPEFEDWTAARLQWSRERGNLDFLDVLRGNLDTRRAIAFDEFVAANPGAEHHWTPIRRTPGNGGDQRAPGRGRDLRRPAVHDTPPR